MLKECSPDRDSRQNGRPGNDLMQVVMPFTTRVTLLKKTKKLDDHGRANECPTSVAVSLLKVETNRTRPVLATRASSSFPAARSWEASAAQVPDSSMSFSSGDMPKKTKNSGEV